LALLLLASRGGETTAVASVSSQWEKIMKRVLILMLAITTLAAARDKKPKAQPGPYVFTSKASAQTLKTLIVQDSLKDGYTLDSDNQFQLRFSKPAQMPFMGALFMIPSACTGMTTKKVWSYTLVELNGVTTVTVQPVWEYPGDYCHTQTHELIWNQTEQIAAFQAMLDKAPAAIAQAPAPTPAAVAPAVAPTPAPVAYQQQDNVRVEPATQPQPVVQDESLGGAARRAKEHQACLELAKDNPSITCK
jgi:hypothetical protein